MLLLSIDLYDRSAGRLSPGFKGATHRPLGRSASLPLSYRMERCRLGRTSSAIETMYVATSNIRQPGIDLALALVSEDLGDHVAMEIAKNMVLFLRRPGGQAQFSVTLQSQRALGSSLDDVSAGFEDHTGEER